MGVGIHEQVCVDVCLDVGMNVCLYVLVFLFSLLSLSHSCSAVCPIMVVNTRRARGYFIVKSLSPSLQHSRR